MIGIISAMQEEVQALLHELKNTSTTEKGKRTYYKGELFGKQVVIVFSRWGKVASAATTTQLINDFDLKELIFTGVAGAIKPQLNIGDVVIGKHLYQHDLDARPFYNQFEIPILKQLYVETKNASKLISATQNFIENYSTYINSTEATNFNITKPKVIEGDIVSGDLFVSSTQKINELNQGIPSALCCEMEGAAVAQVCFEYEIPFSIIRIISDEANDNSHIDFARFANTIASNYALGIFKYYFND
jgi:adenosylhomocysteine nucleosidase